MNEKELGFRAALARYENINTRLTALLQRFGSAEAIFAASAAELASAGLTPDAAWAFVSARKKLNGEKELTIAAKHGIQLIALGNDDYPPLLAQIPDAPILLFVRGNPDALRAKPAIAAIGTRKMTTYGVAVVSLIVRPVATAGANIVSGLALGCDAACHEAALQANATTVAVLGTGVDAASVGPITNARLAERIIEAGGALVSEYAPGADGLKHHFPERNRIIAGLTKATLVIEAAEKSGSLITAFLALEYNRDVYAVPGPITSPGSAGCNKLIARGAAPAIQADTIIEHLGLKNPKRKSAKPKSSDPAQNAILAALAENPLDTDALTAKTGLPPGELFAALTALEIAGSITRTGDRYLTRD
ncbi:MAG: DNA-processing protein DprA [Patescibacteria group bacterium]|nr:DNA-processing protein DprA [Patescibacteria group bacterium]